ncbi:hypothetical protein HK098_005299 [Nowakowskiella sp. JEL0407]|nr:hypothetical protein HK098_005299 [Nowakowskiella sp. JEL0407]
MFRLRTCVESELLKKDPIPIYESIEKDIGRCYPDHQLFQKDGEGQRSLSNVLKAYAQYNPKVGYCQGMGMVAGMLLMYMPAEDTFWMLVALLNTSMRDVYDESLSQLRKDSAVFEYLLHRKFRKISKHLEKNEVTPIMYTAPWFMTLFTSSLPWETVLRFWDMFMCDGIKAEIRVGLAILELSQDKILSLKNTGDILAFLLHVPATLLPPDLVIETAVKIKLKRAKVAELRVKAGKNGVPERGELTLQ